MDGMKNGMCQEEVHGCLMARDARHDEHAGTPASKALRMMVSLAATRDRRHRPRSNMFYDIVATFDEVVGVVPPKSLLEKGKCFLLLKALHGTRMASKRWQRHYMRVLRTHGLSSSKVMLGFFHHRDPAGTCGCHGDGFTAEGSDALLDSLDRVMKDWFDTKMLGLVGRGNPAEIKFNGHCAGMSKRCASRFVTELSVLLGLTDTRALTKTRTPGTKANGGSARNVLRPLDIFQAATFRRAVGWIAYIFLDGLIANAPRKQRGVPLETLRSSTGCECCA